MKASAASPGPPKRCATLDTQIEKLGREAYALACELFPFCRSLSGGGVRDTLAVLDRFIPLSRIGVPSGSRIFDWEVPDEWNVSDAYVKDLRGKRVVDFKHHNLHLVSYSTPVRARLKLAELLEHIHVEKKHPDWIPYRSSYYAPNWGFCVSETQRAQLTDDEYDVCIDSRLEPGELTLAEALIPGTSSDEVIFYTHTCHPSVANDNLSGLAVSALLAREIRRRAPLRYSYRFVFGPATIGSIAWLALNEQRVARIRHGLVLTCLGDAGCMTYKRSRRGAAEIDRIGEYVVSGRHAGRMEPFTPYGYDERQFCSPGFNLPVGRLTRTPNGQYPEYHTSADNLAFISSQSLGHSIDVCLEIVRLLETNARYVNLSPKCEPRLGPRGLLNITAGNPSEREQAILWVLNQSDGEADLLDVATRSGISFESIAAAAAALQEAGLLKRAMPH